MAFFSKNKRVGGEIAYFGLTDWWNNILTQEERNIIRATYKPMMSTHAIDQGNINYSSQSKLGFLGVLAGWLKKKEYYDIGVKIILEGEKVLSECNDILDKHYFFLSAINVYYPSRNERTDALNAAISYCKRQIDISKKVKAALLKEYPTSPLPLHTGYKQLAIIYEKQERYEDAIQILNKALKEGWNVDDSNKRIEKLQKKCSK